ncbi:hypothetical protein RJ640_027454 [Escallonia rubra]|uniref:Uncharacterized protein n=1 Tax=Escallonia rubra TaxID=112253 RepID=A0AA88QQ75_9ASTE|nr:hypothetical protein RJ640_027454 [Escallonia rubra]
MRFLSFCHPKNERGRKIRTPHLVLCPADEVYSAPPHPRPSTLSQLAAKTKCSSLARTESGGQEDAFSNGTASVSHETRNIPQPFSNGAMRPAIRPAHKPFQMFSSPAPAASNNGAHSKVTSPAGNGDMRPRTGKAM